MDKMVLTVSKLGCCYGTKVSVKEHKLSYYEDVCIC